MTWEGEAGPSTICGQTASTLDHGDSPGRADGFQLSFLTLNLPSHLPTPPSLPALTHCSHPNSPLSCICPACTPSRTVPLALSPEQRPGQLLCLPTLLPLVGRQVSTLTPPHQTQRSPGFQHFWPGSHSCSCRPPAISAPRAARASLFLKHHTDPSTAQNPPWNPLSSG